MFANTKLKCFFCNEICDNFKTLGEHVMRAHPNVGTDELIKMKHMLGTEMAFVAHRKEAMSELTKEQTSRIDKLLGSQNLFKENKRMPRNNADDFDEMPDDFESASETMPEPSNPDDERNLEFLKPADVTGPTGKLDLIRVGQPTSYSDIVLIIKYEGNTYRLGLKTFDPGYKALLKKYGTKKSDWHGPLKYKIMPYKGKSAGFVAIRPS